MKKLLTSRTVWTIVVMFVLGGLEAIIDFMPNGTYMLINTMLTALAVYFKLTPSQKY